MSKFVYAMAALALMAPLSATAQQRPGGGSGAPLTPAQAAGGALNRLSSDQFRSRLENEEMRRRTGGDSLTQDELASAEEQYGADRVALANQVQALIDEGKCGDARKLANDSGERAMALHVRRTCR